MQESTSGNLSQNDGGEALNSPSLSVLGEGALLCPHCAAQMPETAAFCPGCGQTVQRERARGRVGRFPENIAGALAYVTFIPAILFLVLEPYKRNVFVRFHSGQCLLLWAGSALAAVAIRLTAVFLFMIPIAGPLMVVLISAVAVILVAVLWLVLVVKALQGEMFKLALLGDLAERNASLL
jgi:uncharacterized membrane protein